MMITGVADAHSAVEALTAGAYDYLTKPFTVAELRTKVFKALERRRLVLENRQYRLHLEQRVQQQTMDLKRALDRVEGAYEHTLEALISSLDVREHETQRHSKRVSEYTRLLHGAGQVGIPQDQLLDIERGSLLHDIGKIGISDNILQAGKTHRGRVGRDSQASRNRVSDSEQDRLLERCCRACVAAS